MLLDLEKMSNDARKKNRKEILDYISKLAINISGANTSALFKIDEVNKSGSFELLFSSGLSRDQIRKIRNLPVRECKILERIRNEKSKIFGSTANNDIKALDPTRKNKNFSILPIKNYGKLRGILFLGFNGERGTDNQELEFLEVFAMHVSSALIHAKIIE